MTNYDSAFSKEKKQYIAKKYSNVSIIKNCIKILLHLFIYVIISDLRLHNQLLFFFFISNRYSDKAASIPNHWHPITLKGEIGVKVCKNFLCHNHRGGILFNIVQKIWGLQPARKPNLQKFRPSTTISENHKIAHQSKFQRCYVIDRNSCR